MGGRGSGQTPRTTRTWIPATDRNPWERQPGESDQAFAGFVAYRNLGLQRTLQKATKVLDKKPGYSQVMGDWSRKFGWVKRTTSWDIHQDRETQEAQLEAKRQAAQNMVHRHLQISTNLQRFASVELARWLHKIGGDTDNPSTHSAPSLTPKDIQVLMDYAIKLERLNRDKPESISEIRDNGLNREEVEERILHLLKAREE